MQWWNNISLRERIIYAVASLIILFILVDSFVVGGVTNSANQLADEIDQAQDDLDWIKRAAPRLSVSSSKNKRPVTGSLVTFVNQQVTRQGLKTNLQKMTPIKDDTVRLRLDDVAFDKLLKLLSVVETTAVSFEEVRLVPTDKEGLVNATLVITREKRT